MKSILISFMRISPLQWFVILSVITIAVALGVPPDAHTLAELHTSSLAFRLAVAALLIPYTVIWFFGFYAYSQLRRYMTHIAPTKEGPAFQKIAIGIGVLAFGLVIPTLIGQILAGFSAHDHHIKAASVITTNYLNLIMPLVAFSYIGSGIHQLALLDKVRPSLLGIRCLTGGFIVLGVVYSYLVMHNRYQAGNPYHLGPWPLILTFVAPYLYAWFVGLFGAYELRLYSHKTSGKLYRQALDQFSYGLVVAIAGSVAIQFVSGAINTNRHLSLPTVLLADYLLVIVVAVGLALLAHGAKSLRRIEEV